MVNTKIPSKTIRKNAICDTMYIYDKDQILLYMRDVHQTLRGKFISKCLH